jgi:hypothetical protein
MWLVLRELREFQFSGLPGQSSGTQKAQLRLDVRSRSEKLEGSGSEFPI